MGKMGSLSFIFSKLAVSVASIGHLVPALYRLHVCFDMPMAARFGARRVMMAFSRICTHKLRDEIVV
jgi:uncharacterized YccA/Bax inhibitor family protein